MAFNVNPGFVLTERNSLDADEFGFAAAQAGPPEAVGAAIAWLVTSREADPLQRSNIDAQDLALDRGLYPDWRRTAD
jgi:NAD(P)-dependent dehydrogenase (short-subunit alcohol dehydrogenase family)